MPKTKSVKKVEKIKAPKDELSSEIENIKPKIKPGIIEEDDEEKAIDPDGILGDDSTTAEAAGEDDEDGGLDEDEVDPFKDKWEE